jgi:hypothetical protein
MNESKGNYYDNNQKNVNIYQLTPINKWERENSRNYNIISGRHEERSVNNRRKQDDFDDSRSQRSNIRKNFYDELNYKRGQKRDISQKRRVDTERRSRLSRSRRPSSRSIAKSQISMT